MGNMSLILGTILSQLAVGTFITGYVVDQILHKAEEKKAATTSLAAFIIGFIGVIAVFTHLGVPTHAFNALLNLGTSWLSRESLCYGLFMALLFIYVIIQKGIIKDKQSVLKGLGGLTAILGILLAFVTAMIYMVPGVPAWNSASTPVSFMLSALMMGVPLGVYLSDYREGRIPALITGMAALCAMFVTISHVTSLQAGNAAQSASGYLMSGSGMFLLRLALLAVAVVCGLYYGMKGSRQTGEGAEVKSAGASVFLLLFAVLVVAEFIGRMLFFSTIVRM